MQTTTLKLPEPVLAVLYRLQYKGYKDAVLSGPGLRQFLLSRGKPTQIAPSFTFYIGNGSAGAWLWRSGKPDVGKQKIIFETSVEEALPEFDITFSSIIHNVYDSSGDVIEHVKLTISGKYKGKYYDDINLIFKAVNKRPIDHIENMLYGIDKALFDGSRYRLLPDFVYDYTNKTLTIQRRKKVQYDLIASIMFGVLTNASCYGYRERVID